MKMTSTLFPGSLHRMAPWAMGFLAVALLLPALIYSLQTGFGLIDDISDWQVASEMAHSRARSLAWFRDTFLTFGPGRYRPLFELSTMANWALWGPHPALHHASRWAIKLITLAALLLTLRGTSPKQWAPWPALLLAYLFLFYPNQPDARLAPQELNSVACLALLNLILAHLHMRNASNLATLGRPMLLGLYATCVGLSWSKEINIAALAWLSVWLTGWAIIHRSRRAAWRSLPVILLTLYTALRLAAAARGAAYGVEPLTWALCLDNVGWLAGQWLQTSTSWGIAIPLILLSGGLLFLLLRRLPELDPRDRVDLLVWGQMAALFLMVCTSWRQILRYWYPLVPLLAYLVASAAARLQAICATRGVRYARGFELTCALFLLYFTGCNLHAFYAQYAVQHHARLIEHMVFAEGAERLLAGQHLFNRVNQEDTDWEFNRSLQLYFNDYLPQQTGAEERLLTTPPPGHGEGYLLASTPFNGAVRLLKTYERRWPSPFMAATYNLSARLQGRRVIQARIDAGSSDPMSYRWYLYRVNP